MQYEEIPTQHIIEKLRQTLEPRIGIAEPSLPGRENSAITFGIASLHARDEDDEDIALLKAGFD
ncbi:MAG: hypothetical protein ICV80_09365, partial [Microcoleus sp. T1-bin1]|nr:hypothetical protein [Microcoleus sp. T1-bin1]